MKTRFSAVAATLLGLGVVLASPLASAHKYDRDEYRRSYDDEEDWGRHGHWRRHGHDRRIVERTVIVQEAPRSTIYQPVYVAPPRPVYEPAYVRERPVFRRDPAVTISVDLPPLVFPIR